MYFNCSHTWEDGITDSWEGTIDSLINYGNYCEIFITSRSTLHLILGKYSNGIFVVSPYYGGTYLSNRLDDIFYNTERMIKVFDNVVDGVTAAKAILVISSKINFYYSSN
jgi:hypothetical protein